MKLAITGLIIMSSLFSSLKDTFNEAEWEQTTNSVDKSLFYAEHKKDGLFFNPWLLRTDIGVWEMLKWRFSSTPEYSEEAESFLPNVEQLTAEYINSNDNFFVWLGHASLIFKINGMVILVDPVLGEIPFVSKRRVPAALSYAEAKKIKGDVTVLITHNHYDHFDTKSIESMPHETIFIVPKEVGSDVEDMAEDIEGISITEMDWWETVNINNMEITFLPSQHWSRRSPFDTNESLWGSFMIKTGKKKIFICGDTGYTTIYKEIALKFPGIDYAFMSAGAYEPRWFMHYAHQSAAEAILGFKQLGAKKMIPIHWGSFRLGDEPVGYPALQLKEMYDKTLVLDGGQIIKL